LLNRRVTGQTETALLRDKILRVYNSSQKKTDEQFKELMRLQQEMKSLRQEKDSVYMMLLQKIGVLYFRKADYLKAISFTNESVTLAKLYISNALPLVQNYSNLFFYYNRAGDEKNEYEVIDSCIEYAFKCNAGFDMTIGPLEEKVQYLFSKGQYSLCTRYARLGQNITVNYYHDKDSIGTIAFFIIMHANALYFSKNSAEAEIILQNSVSEFLQNGYDKLLGTFYNLLGLINEDNGKYTTALSYFQKSYEKNKLNKYKNGCAKGLHDIGTLYAYYFKKPDIGLQYCNHALQYAEDASDSLFILKQIANIYTLKKMYDTAFRFFQLAFNEVQPGMNETTLLKNSFQYPGLNLLQNISDLVTDKADAFVKEYYTTKNKNFLKQALIIYKKNDIFLAKIKTEQQLDLSSNLVWRTTARNLYEHAIEACNVNADIEDAFYFFEKSRAILLNDQINEQRWMADTDIAKEGVLKKNIIELDNKLNTAPASSNEYLKIQRELIIKNQELDVLTDSIKNKNPLYYKSYLDTSFITLSQLRENILNNSKALVEIFSGDSAVYVLTIASDNQSLSKINKQLYDSLTRSFTSFISNRYVLNKHFKDFIKTSHQLYNLLFQNIKSPDGSIIISPDGINFPFEALALNESIQQPDYFLNHYATSYTYSIKYLTNQFAANASNNNSVLGIAPVQYNYQNLAELPGSDASLKNINKYFSNATNLVLERATKNSFLQSFPGYNIIQLYTHASDSSMNNDPVIYFSDSALYLSSLIPDRKPVTQLVVLSACETANGKLYRGEGIFSFNRGFAALGIPAAISNLWSVDNESTYQITELFYKYLSQGLLTDIALQKAKLEFINKAASGEKKLPYFWAGSILTGKVDIIRSEPDFEWIKLIVITILVLAFFYLIWRVLRSRMGSNLN
jgi:CHAT domain-containing protein